VKKRDVECNGINVYIGSIGAIDMQPITYNDNGFDMKVSPSARMKIQRPPGFCGSFLGSFFLLLFLSLPSSRCSGEDRVDFEKQILPIFEQKCFECHSGGGKKKPKAGLRLDVADAIIKGTKRKKIIEPHRPDDSTLIEVVSLPADDDDLMPPSGKGKPLTKGEVSLLRRWITEGAGFAGWLSVVQGKNPPPPKSAGVVRERIPRISDLYPRLAPAKKLKAAVAQIDSLIDKKLAAEGVEAFPEISDEVFLRRIYLDVAGRIPTPAEAEAFSDDHRRGRRSRLIDKLLDSEAFVSHFYNFWADIFRVRFSGRTVATVEAFSRWIKSSIRENKPYDQFVHEMLSATGNALENPAVGYWYRDLNMKVDSLAYTTQIFLGTQMDCAQCHDHPFDQWSQYDFFQLAAYVWDNKMQGYIPRWVSKETFLENSLRLRKSTKTKVDGKVVVTWSDVPARKGDERKRAQMKARYSDLTMDEIRRTDKTSYDTGIYQNYVRMWARERRDIVKARTEDGLYDSRSEASIDSSAARMMEEVNYLLGYSLRRGEKGWSQLPDTYRYGNAKPNDKVLPKIPFGEAREVDEKNPPHEVFADWFTSRENPMFARVISNRLFEYVFGQGVYRVRDDIKATDEASNPELMALLEKRMLADKFDMKKFLRVLYNTRAYQRQAWAPSPSDKDKSSPGWPYYYPGPLLKRMSAEQIWDSLMTMIVPEVDRRKKYFRYGNAELFKAADKLPPAELYEFCKDIIKEESLAGAGLKKDRGEKAKGSKKYSTSRAGAFEGSAIHAGYSQSLARASELYQPMRAGHFLRAFGQSDREQIENSNRLSNVPQNLTLMNGFVGRYLLSESYEGRKGRQSRRGAVLWNSLLAEEDSRKRIELLYLGVLSRRPSADELADIIAVADPADKKGLADVFWALVNTEEFRFVQ